MYRARLLACVAVVAATTAAPVPSLMVPADAAGASTWGHTDFDGDGDDELVVATPSESLGTIQDAGSITVLRGSPGGVTTAGAQIWTQGTAGISGLAETGDRFGESWAAGDFDDDGFDDLAIGIPGDNLRGSLDAGRVQVLFGSRRGLTPAGEQLLAEVGVEQPEAGDRFGTAIAAADFDSDGDTDLAIGAPGETVGGDAGAGAVFVFRATAAGFGGAPTIWTQATPGIGGAPEVGDAFGSALAAGRVGYNKRSDLVVGAPRENLAGAADAGAVQVLYGSGTGFATDTDQLFTLDDIEPGFVSTGLIGIDALSADAGDRFGTSLTISQQASSHYPLVIAGAPFDDDPRSDVAADIGSVAVLVGAPGAGLDVVGGNAPNDSDGVDAFGPGRQFGRALTTRSAGDWYVAVPGIPDNADAAVGEVWRYDWTNDPAEPTNNDEGIFYLRQSNVDETDEAGDEFGGGLWSADVDGDGAAAVVVGWRESLEDEGIEQAGMVAVQDPDGDVALFTQSTPGLPETNQNFDRFGVQAVP